MTLMEVRRIELINIDKFHSKQSSNQLWTVLQLNDQ